MRGNDYKTRDVPLTFTYKGETFNGNAIPVATRCSHDVCFELNVTLNNKALGTIYCGKDMQWKFRGNADQELINKIGEEIQLWYE